MNPPGGRIVTSTGGYLQLWNWAAPFAGGGVYPPTPLNYYYVDVAYWRLNGRTLFAERWGSGNTGAIRRRIVGYDWRLSIRVWWNYGIQPEQGFFQGDSLAIKLTIGSEQEWTGNNVQRAINFQQVPPTVTNQQLAGLPPNPLWNGILNPASESFIPSYCSPLAYVSEINPVNDSSSLDDGVFYQDWVIEGDSRMYYINDQEDAAQYQSYLTVLAAQGDIAYEP